MTDGIARCADGRVQRRKDRKDGFNKTKRQRFLDALALTCNVRRAALFAGVHPATVFRVRQNEVAFAEQWAAALAVGCDRLEVKLIEHGGAGEPLDWPDAERAAAAGADAEVPAFDFDRALKVLEFQRRQGERGARNIGNRRGESREATNALLIKALARAKRRVARDGGDDA